MAVKVLENPKTGRINEQLIVAEYSMASKTIALSHVPLVLLSLGQRQDTSQHTQDDLILSFPSSEPSPASLPQEVPASMARAPSQKIMTLNRAPSSKLSQTLLDPNPVANMPALTPYQRIVNQKLQK